VISIVSVILLLGALGFTAFNFAEGTLFGDDVDCEWSPVNPDDRGTFSSMNEFQSYLDSRNGSVPEGFEVEFRDGVVQQRLVDCEPISIGGEA